MARVPDARQTDAACPDPNLLVRMCGAQARGKLAKTPVTVRMRADPCLRKRFRNHLVLFSSLKIDYKLIFLKRTIPWR